jgi:hypothetical protein
MLCSWIPKLTALFLSASFIPILGAQEAPATPASILHQVLVSLGAARLSGSSMNGTFQSFAGSDADEGNFTAKCGIDGSSNIQFQTATGPKTETRNSVDGVTAGTWTDSHGEIHSMAQHNTLGPGAWFCPHLALGELLADSSLRIQYQGQTTKDGQLVDDFYIAKPAVDNKPISVWMAQLTGAHLYLDSQSLRPSLLSFNIHPDNNATIDLPVVVQFSNYTSINGLWLPLHIDRYVNSTLNLSLELTASSLSNEPAK